MDELDFLARRDIYVGRVENALRIACDEVLKGGSRVSEAARYSLLGGGKRVRGTLVLAAAELYAGDGPLAECFAAAVEMVHAYSLIHDDLPCMDNDDMRRGMPSCHCAFDEATALLAGDALLTAAFAQLARSPGTDGQKAAAMSVLAQAAGPRGMVYGQELDLYYENTPATEGELTLVHRHKTGDMIVAAAMLGAATADKSPADVPALVSYAEKIGLAFQIIDDILDVTGDEASLGKPVFSDAGNHKTTFVTLYGVEGAYARAQALTREAVSGMEGCSGPAADFLSYMARSLVARQK